MALLDIPLERITEVGVRCLIAAGAAESLYIDYNQATYGGKEADHAELLADVSSFANTAGGDLVIGVAEAGGIPNAIVPFTGNADDERRRLEDIARTGLEPRIRNFQTRAVALAEGGAVMIVRVPRSYAPLHRVIYKNRSRFWARASSGKYEPNVEELRHIFNEAPRIAERIAALRTNRTVRIMADETPVPLGPGGRVVLHVVPVAAQCVGDDRGFRGVRLGGQRFQALRQIVVQIEMMTRFHRQPQKSGIRSRSATSRPDVGRRRCHQSHLIG
jgi:hypothetical protein